MYIFKGISVFFLALLSMLFGFCSTSCPIGGDAPRMDIIDELSISQINDWDSQSRPEETICYDENAYYFLRKASDGNMELCCSTSPGHTQVLLSLYSASDIASWNDMLVIRGRVTKEENDGILVLGKQNPARVQATIDLQEKTTIALADARGIEAEISLVPLRLALYGAAPDVLLQDILKQYTACEIPEKYEKGEWEDILSALGMRIKGEQELSTGWILDTGVFLLELRASEEIPAKFILRQAYVKSGAYGGILYPLWGTYESRYISYEDKLFEVDAPRRGPILNKDYAPVSIWDISQSKEAGLQFDVEQEYFFGKVFADGDQRIQYFVFSKYCVEEIADEYLTYLQSFTGHKILAIDLETMQQTRELTLSAPREQVLYVNEAGAYTWRHDEGRVFFTPWQGEAVAVSEPIPYVPRYETPEYEAQGDACNRWYAEVDHGRLLLFDITQGETALLAVVELPY